MYVKDLKDICEVCNLCAIEIYANVLFFHSAFSFLHYDVCSKDLKASKQTIVNYP